MRRSLREVVRPDRSQRYRRSRNRQAEMRCSHGWGKSTFRDQRKDISFISFGFISCLTTANLREISVPFRQPGGERANKQWSNGHFAQIGQAGRASTSAAWAEPYLLAPPPPAAGRGSGGLVLPGETAAHASETLAYSGICVRHGITRLGNPYLRTRALCGSITSACFCPAVPRGAVQQFWNRRRGRP